MLRRRAGLVLLPWMAVALNAVTAKYNQIVMSAVSDTLVGAPAFAIKNHIYEFKYDLLLGFVVMPALLLSLVALTRRWRWVLGLTAAWAMLWQIIMSAEMATYAMANSYATFRTMVMAFVWAVKHPKNQFLTLPLFDKIYANCWMALVAMVILLVTVIPFRRRLWWSRVALVTSACLVVVTAASAFARGDDSLRVLLFRDVAMSLVERSDSKMMARSIPELMSMYRADSYTVSGKTRDEQFAGKAKGYNVVLVVMESMSAEVFDPAKDSLEDMPNVRRLRQTAFVGQRHYTSYPLTNRASFGIFTSIYSESPVGFALNDRDIKLPGMIRDLDNAGYQTGYYGFVWRDEEQRDDSMLDSLGFDRIADPLEKEPELPSAELMFGGDIHKAAGKDHEALLLLRKDIKEWTAKKQKFAAAFFPEMGHDPWRSLTDDESLPPKVLGHQLAVYQDKFIGELIDELQRDKVLDRTIIVVTADHGQRTIADANGEEVLISHGRLDDRTLRVPLLIYVPKVLRQTTALPGPTSHIDVAPTLLGLLGVDEDGALQQGMPMWRQKDLEKRRLFLPMNVFGASGYYENGMYFMTNQGLVYRGKQMQFANTALPYNSDEAKAVRELVARHSAMQAAIVDHLINGK